MLKSLFKKPPPEGLTITTDQLALLAVEHWRLSKPSATVPRRPRAHALRKIEDLLKSYGIEVPSLDGVQYDPGMSVSVIDRVIHPAVPPGLEAIVETVSPLVLCQGQVIKAGEVVVGKCE